jgi:glycosyltransferase involved in cell wall biosynthesis
MKEVKAPYSESLPSNLPSSPSGKTGWPWTLSSTPMPRLMPDGRQWPRISVITPSFNQVRFIEQTIRSVILQEYPNLEYIVIDGGSTDGSVEIIRRYDQQLAHWESEPDRGQSHAINKGFARATGEIMSWLNSDDFYLPGTLRAVAENLAFGAGAFAIVGHYIQVHVDGSASVKGLGRFESLQRLLQFWKGYQMPQPSIFWRREVFEKVGYLDENQHYIMDFDYWVRMARHYEFKNIDRTLSCANYHEDAKTGDNFSRYQDELWKHAADYWPSPFKPAYWQLKASMIKHTECLPLVRRFRNSIFYRFGWIYRLIASSRSR